MLYGLRRRRIPLVIVDEVVPPEKAETLFGIQP